MSYNISFPTGNVTYQFGETQAFIQQLHDNRKVILLTDSNIYNLYTTLFLHFRTIVIEPGEQNKNLDSLALIIEQLIAFEADRKTLLVVIGGGVVTDIAGFAASVYMRGVKVGFIPTTLLGMVDAAIGGKNGINYGLYKNMLGVVRQPEFIYFDTAFLHTLPVLEWSNGFAEIIKYGCIFDSFLFETLMDYNIDFYKTNQGSLEKVIEKCISWKNKTVQEDEKETGIRKLLNFGHTAGHAIEKQYHLPHGYAISIGMIIACMISERVARLDPKITLTLKKLLQQYLLPTYQTFSSQNVLSVLKMDKKRNNEKIDFIVLKRIGEAAVEPISLEIIQETLEAFTDGSHS